MSQKSAKSAYFAENIADSANCRRRKDSRKHGYPLPPCFAKKRLEGIENKGLGLTKCRKKRLYVVENIQGLFAAK
jgi:hypothetical protein